MGLTDDNKVKTQSKYIKNHTIVQYTKKEKKSKKTKKDEYVHRDISSAKITSAPSSKYIRSTKSEEIYKNFDVHNPLLSFGIVVGTFLIYFLTNSGAGYNYGSKLLLCIALVLPVVALLSRKSMYYSPQLGRVYTAFAIMAALMFISYTKSFDYFTYIRMLLMFSIPITASYLGYNERGLKYISYANTAIGVGIVVDYAAGGITGGWNSNAIGSVALYGMVWLIFTGYERQRWRLATEIAILVFSMLRMEITQCRSAMIGLLLLIAFHYFVPARALAKKLIYRIIYISVLCFPPIITHVLLWLHKSEFALNADKWIYEHTEKSLFTGREGIWYSLLNEKITEPFFGAGGSYWYNNHSVYMYMRCSVGIVGFIAYVVFLALIFEFLFKHIKDYTVRCSVVAFSAIYITGAFEEILIKPDILCLVFYMPLAVGVGRACMLEKAEKTDQAERGAENGVV